MTFFEIVAMYKEIIILASVILIGSVFTAISYEYLKRTDSNEFINKQILWKFGLSLATAIFMYSMLILGLFGISYIVSLGIEKFMNKDLPISNSKLLIGILLVGAKKFNKTVNGLFHDVRNDKTTTLNQINSKKSFDTAIEATKNLKEIKESVEGIKGDSSEKNEDEKNA